MTSRFRIYTDHAKGIPAGEPLYRSLTETKAKRIVKTLASRGIEAIYAYSEIDSI